MKINAIKTPVARKLMSTAMLAAATLGVTNVMAKPSKAQEAMPTQTEVMSPEVAQAVQAQSGSSIPKIMNSRLNNKLVALDSRWEAIIPAAYTDFGTYGATVLIANRLITTSMDNVIKMQERYYADLEHYAKEGDGEFKPWISRPEFEKRMNSLKNWKGNFMNNDFEAFHSLINKKASFSDYSKFIDDRVSNDPGFASRKDEYFRQVNKFAEAQTTTGVMKQSDLLYFRLYYMYKIAFEQSASNAGITSYGKGASAVFYVDGTKRFDRECKPTP